MALALDEMKASGTGLVGDISNSLAHLDVLEASGLEGVVFHEVIKFRATGAEQAVDESRRIEAARLGRWRLALYRTRLRLRCRSPRVAAARPACGARMWSWPSPQRRWSPSGGSGAGPMC
jgi:hypothetical protein